MIANTSEEFFRTQKKCKVYTIKKLKLAKYRVKLNIELIEHKLYLTHNNHNINIL